ncbi:MAG: hypothetical protein KC613_24220, partial [Myxococcales bacterium]|nr:hypothetical protein [Myxococcales bacterium]
HPAKVGPDGRAAIPQGDAAGLLARVLAMGKPLQAGDVVVAAPPPVVGPPDLAPAEPMPSLRATLRRDLARAVARGLASPAYLRPGSVLAVDGDLLGRLALRVAVPPGVAAPTPDALPLVTPRGGPP